MKNSMNSLLEQQQQKEVIPPSNISPTGTDAKGPQPNKPPQVSQKLQLYTWTVYVKNYKQAKQRCHLHEETFQLQTNCVQVLLCFARS